MELFKSAFSIACINLRRWIRDRRVCFTLLFMGILVCFYLRPLISYSLKTDQKCSAYLLPLLFKAGAVSVNLPKALFHLGMLILLCDAPFLTRITPYMVIRSRRSAWCLGECIYIILAALLYTLFLTAVSTFITLPVADFRNDWGGVMRDLIYGRDGLSTADLLLANRIELTITPYLYRYVYPQGGQLYTFIALWGAFSFLGLLMYVVSLMSKKLLPGMCVSGIFIFLDPLLTSWQPVAWIQILSPVTWTSIDRMRSPAEYRFMTIPMALSLYAVLILILIFAAWAVSRRVTIENRGRG